jgi:hypothetical protein
MACPVYRLDVPGDVRDTTHLEGRFEGDTIRFQIKGFHAGETAGGHNGTYTVSTQA